MFSIIYLIVVTPPLTDHPDYIFPLVLTSATQELFGCRADEDLTGENPYKLLKKEDIIKDMKTRASVSDFSPVKQLVLVRFRNIFWTHSWAEEDPNLGRWIWFRVALWLKICFRMLRPWKAFYSFSAGLPRRWTSAGVRQRLYIWTELLSGAHSRGQRKHTEGEETGQTEGRTDRQTDRRTDR